MSGTLIPLMGQPADILGNLAKWQNLSKENAATALTQQQAQGQNLTNQQSALMLGLRNQLVGAIAPGAPNATPGAGGAIAPGVPGAMTPGMPSATSDGGQPAMPPPISLAGATMTPFGVPVPRAAYISSLMAPEPLTAMAKAIDMGHSYMAQRLGALGQRPTDPAAAAQWDKEAQGAAQELYSAGWIGSDGYQHLMRNPGSVVQLSAAMADPNTQLNVLTKQRENGYSIDQNGNVVPNPGAVSAIAGKEATVAGAKTAAEKAAENPLTLTTVNMKNPDGSVTPTQMHTDDALRMTRTSRTGGAPDNMSALPSPQQAVISRVADATGIEPNVLAGHKLNESGGGASAPPGTGGTMQMTKATLDTFNAKHGTHFTTADIEDPNSTLGTQVGAEHLVDLRKQFGDPVRASIAYNWGPAATQKWIDAGADPAQLPNSVRSYIAKIYGPNAFAGQQPGAAATQPAQTGAGQGITELTPQQKADIETQKSISVNAGEKNIGQVTDYQNAALEKAQTAQRMNALIDQARIESQNWTSGQFADHKMAALKMIDGLRQNINTLAGKEILGAPDPSVGSWEAFNKNMLANVSSAVREVSPRAAVQEFQTIQKTQPQDTTSPQGIRQLFDEMQGINDWLQAKSEGAAKLNKATGLTNEFEANWNKSITPLPFIVHRMSDADYQTFAGNMKKSEEGKEMLRSLSKQMQFLDSQGFFAPTNVGLPTGRQP